MISWPVMVTFSTLPASTSVMKSLNGTGLGRALELAWRNSTPPTATTTRTIQNTRLFNVEFTLYPPDCTLNR